MTGDVTPLAAVLLAHGEANAAMLRAMIDASRAAGARPVVVVLPRDSEAPEEVRIARVQGGGSPINALRAGMALLTNTTARLALVWPVDGAEAEDAARVGALVAEARREGAAVTAFAHDDLDASPVVVARDAWLELVTLGEQGMAAVAARRGLCSVAPRD